jgi:hypothetical protein
MFLSLLIGAAAQFRPAPYRKCPSLDHDQISGEKTSDKLENGDDFTRMRHFLMRRKDFCPVLGAAQNNRIPK